MHRVGLDPREAFSLAIPYWRSDERSSAGALILTLVFLNLGLVLTTLLFTIGRAPSTMRWRRETGGDRTQSCGREPKNCYIEDDDGDHLEIEWG
jgi:hypothetical protein